MRSLAKKKALVNKVTKWRDKGLTVEKACKKVKISPTYYYNLQNVLAKEPTERTKRKKVKNVDLNNPIIKMSNSSKLPTDGIEVWGSPDSVVQLLNKLPKNFNQSMTIILDKRR